jgi:hypothetical protein
VGFLGPGIALIAIGLFVGGRTWLFLRGAAATEGRVVSLDTYSGSRGTTYAPVVEYRSPDGAIHRIEDQLKSNRPGLKVGDVVPVRYDPGEPSRGRLAKPYRLWALPAFLLLMGASLLAAELA